MAKRTTQSSERTLYFVECDFGKAGLSFVQRDPSDMDRKTTIADIIAGEWHAPVVKVVAVTPGTCSAEDVTEEILAEAGMTIADDQAPSRVEHAAWLNDRAYDERKHEVAV